MAKSRKGNTYLKNGVSYTQKGRYRSIRDQPTGEKPRKHGKSSSTFKNNPQNNRVGTDEKKTIARQKAANKNYQETNKELLTKQETQPTQSQVIKLDQQGTTPVKPGQSASEVTGQPDPETEIIDLTTQQTEKTGIAAFRERDTIAGKLVKAATSLKTTVVLGTILAAVLTAGAATGTVAGVAGKKGAATIARGVGGRAFGRGSVQAARSKGSTAVLNRWATVIKGSRAVRKGTVINEQRAIVGRGSRRAVDKLFKAGRNIRATTARRFPANTKSIATTEKMLIKKGMSPTKAIGLAATVGTYPFAKFELAEMNDKIGIAMFKAADAGNFQEMEDLDQYMTEINDPSFWGSVISTIPYANVYRAAAKNTAAAIRSQETFSKLAADMKAESEGTKESKYDVTARESRERKLKEREEDKRYFEKQRRESRKRKEEEQREEDKRFKKIREDKAKEKEAEREADKKYYANITKVSSRETNEERDTRRKEESAYYQGLREERDRAAEEKKAKDRAEDEAYFESVRKKNEELDLKKRQDSAYYYDLIAKRRKSPLTAEENAWINKYLGR